MPYGCYIFSGEEVFDAVWCTQFTHEVTAITFLGNHLRVTHLLKMVKNEHHVCSLQGRKPLCTGPKQVIIFTFCNWTRSCIFLCRAHETCLLDPVPLHVFSATTTDKPLEKRGRYTARMWLNLTQKVCEKVNKPPIVPNSGRNKNTKEGFPPVYFNSAYCKYVSRRRGVFIPVQRELGWDESARANSI